ncbi:MAG: dipeptidase [Alphaproteobacteria bacterium]|nr:dipeptidase [Alphaproteobacteria bacterium]
MPAKTAYDGMIVIDGLIISKFSRAVFKDMRKGGLTAANCTCSVWEDFEGTMRNVAAWNRMFRENADLVMPVRTTKDILKAKKAGKTGIILGFQNISAFEDQIGYVQLFKDVGVGVAQMAYNTQNLCTTGCYESVDRGLSDFGREVVAEMNRVGIMCDLSHVGSKSSDDVIRASKKPVCYSHVCPSALKKHPRNKSDEELRFIVQKGGFVGVTMFPPFLAKGNAATVDDYVATIDYVIKICGEDQVGVGTDFTQDQDEAFFSWLTHDKGYARELVKFAPIQNPKGIRRIGDFPNLMRAMQKARWPARKIEKVMGENWVAILKEVWGA